MRKIALTIIFLLGLCHPALPEEKISEFWYDSGVFAFESGDYGKAAMYMEKALAMDSENPYYLHLMGKIGFKTKKFETAAADLEKAFAIAPGIPGLKYDLARTWLELADYRKAGELFSEIAEKEPENIPACYYAGISFFRSGRFDDALGFLTKAAQKSPSFVANSNYFAGICYFRLEKPEKAKERFTFVKDNAELPELRASAEKWLASMKERKAGPKPYRLYVKLTAQYDDNAGLDPPEKYIPGVGGEEDDFVLAGMASGSWDFWKREKLVAGAGYSHYQSKYRDLGEYDMTAAMPFLYAGYRRGNLTFGLRYLPAFYWVDSDSWLKTHRIEPGLLWKITDQSDLRATVRYSDDNYDDDDRDGHSAGIALNFGYNFAKGKGRLAAELAYSDQSAAESRYAYDLLEVGLAVSYNTVWDLTLRIEGNYLKREHDGEEPGFNEKRDDDRTKCAIAISRRLLYEWLQMTCEYAYTKNDSNIYDYEYEQNVLALSATARF